MFDMIVKFIYLHNFTHVIIKFCLAGRWVIKRKRNCFLISRERDAFGL